MAIPLSHKTVAPVLSPGLAALAAHVARLPLIRFSVAWAAFVLAIACRSMLAAEPALSFDPLQCKYLDRVQKQLSLTSTELDLYKRQGFVVVDQRRAYNFGTAYRHIYSCDLPVLITSDSVLHIMHRSFDNMLMELEEQVLHGMLAGILESCHAELGRRGVTGTGLLADGFRDVDLYLTVARNLLAGVEAGSRLEQRSHYGQDSAAEDLLRRIVSLHLESPLLGQGTPLYGGRRPVDYSQFKPRGHYTKTSRLQNYFRAMMWLSRPDCGFNVLGAAPSSGLVVDGNRELLGAAVLADVLRSSKQMSRLNSMDRMLNLLAGCSDNLRPQELGNILEDGHFIAMAGLAQAQALQRLRDAVERCPSSRQRLCGQVIFGSKEPGQQTPLPVVFQLLGQRFAVDAYVLANVVYDAVPHRDERGRLRTMPQGLDIMAALGSAEAWRLLESDLVRWKYRPQLEAARDFAATYMADPSNQNSLYTLWLGALVALNSEPTDQAGFPQAMRTEAWHRKQLRAQLGSWAELCHDARILYVKQSYTRHWECEYPAGFVEPYPEFYARARAFAQRAVDGLGEIQADLQAQGPHAPETVAMANIGASSVAFWRGFASTMVRIETLASKELKSEPFSSDDQRFLKETVSVRRKDLSGCGKGPWETSYNGWYCRLLYPDVKSIEKFEPTVADVHTDPNGAEVLQVGVGHANLALVAVDNGSDHMAYVGPVYSYYEFRRPASGRLTDTEFRSMLDRGDKPLRPAWTRSFEPGSSSRPAATP